MRYGVGHSPRERLLVLLESHGEELGVGANHAVGARLHLHFERRRELHAPSNLLA